MKKLSSICLVLLLALVPAQAALFFPNTVGNVAHVDCGSAANLDNWTALTVLTWIYPTEAAQFTIPRIFFKGSKYLATSDIITGNQQFRLQINRATTNAAAQTVDGALETNKWLFLAGTYDESDGPRIFKGDLTTTVSEVSYDSRTVGAGATSSDATDALRWGNRESSPSDTHGFRGRIAAVAYINQRLTLGELKTAQFKIAAWVLSTGNTKDFHLFGFNGTGTQPDWSGSANNGTVTVATVADHVPLPQPF